MITYIKNYTLEFIRYKFLILYLLNVADIFFTLLLLSTGFYIEANILMAKAVESIVASFILKILLPAVLLFYLYVRVKKASEKQLKYSNIIINIAIAVYGLINIAHILWFLIYGVYMFTTQL